MSSGNTTAKETRDDETRRPPSPLRHAPFLFLLVECDRPAAGGGRFALADVDQVDIGRGDRREFERQIVQGARRLALRVPGECMSSRHARIVRVGDKWVLYDCQSRNGCRVNGHRVEVAELADGDVLELGRTLFSFRRAIPASEPAADVLAQDGLGAIPGLATVIPQLDEELRVLQRIAASAIPTLVFGESGTGKELVAGALHALSKRPGPFVAVNCASIPASLVESTLFGHVKGAFSGATSTQPGLVQSADGGTLFLDELGELPLPAQASLLRVLQDGTFVSVGSTRPLRVDIRVVAATNRSLERQIAAGEFRSDLFARLDGYAHTLRPLRERIDDLGVVLPPILRAALPAGAPAPRFTPDFATALVRYEWPLNIRELRQVVARAIVLAGGEPLDLANLPAAIARDPKALQSLAPAAPPELTRDVLRRELEAQFRKSDGNVAAVARAMGKAPTQIRRWLKSFGMDPDTFRR